MTKGEDNRYLQGAVGLIAIAFIGLHYFLQFSFYEGWVMGYGDLAEMHLFFFIQFKFFQIIFIHFLGACPPFNNWLIPQISSCFQDIGFPVENLPFFAPYHCIKRSIDWVTIQTTNLDKKFRESLTVVSSSCPILKTSPTAFSAQAARRVPLTASST